MKILITGVRGNIGSQLVPFLEKNGHEVFGVDIVQGTGVNYKVADINYPGDLFDVFRTFKPEVCYHMAAMVSRVTCEYSPNITIQTNISGTRNIVNLCMMYNTRLIFFSTSEVYGNTGGLLSEVRDPEPNNLYGFSKMVGEMYVRYEWGLGLDAVIVRPFMFYHEDETRGDHRSAMIRFVTNLHEGKKIEVHRNSGRSWMHMDDACDVLARILNIKGNFVMNIGSSDYIYTENLAKIICQKMNKDYDSFCNITTLPGQMTLTKIPDISRMMQLTGKTEMTVSLEEGIDRVINRVISGR